jgi:hypothetical protein
MIAAMRDPHVLWVVVVYHPGILTAQTWPGHVEIVKQAIEARTLHQRYGRWLAA